MTNWVNICATTLGIFLTLLFLALLVVYLYRYFAGAEGKDRLARVQDAEEKADWRVVLASVALAFVASRFLMILGGALYSWGNGSLGWYLTNLDAFWTRWDAHHYIGLIRNWYVNEGDPRFHIVFFPLYPAIGRAIHLSTGLSPTACAYLVSNLAFLGCGVVMYRLAELSQGARGGMRAMLLLMFSPLTVFCSAPYTESVFLLTTLLAVYLARKRKFVWAVVCGALSANARMLGMATAVPIFYEMLRASEGGYLKRYALSALQVLPVSAGLIAYIYLNYAVTGDPLRFLKYQSEHWGQNFGSLMGTVEYSLKNAVQFDTFNYRIGVWIPQIISIILVLVLLAAVLRRAHPGDMGYAMIYYYASIAPTWLLSGPRYLTALYAVYPALALLTQKKWAFAASMAASAILCQVAGVMYSVIGCIL